MSVEQRDIRVYTVPELVKLFKLNPQSVRSYLKDGRLKGRKVGIKWLVTEEAIREFLNGGNQK
ncbi:MAG TPA: helix-turn-helix domain-containing protein [Desulfosporosinus sp.]|nr:helix-turn-helix domain-containing protein [Desulfosporosinus sp.]